MSKHYGSADTQMKSLDLIALCLSCTVLFNHPAFGQAAGQQTATVGNSAAPIQTAVAKLVFDELTKLVKTFFPNAKLIQNGAKLHFEYKAAPQISNSTHLPVVGPKVGGILGDVEISRGQSTAAAKLQNEYYYQTVFMVPYSAIHDCHLNAKLSYPPETSSDFVDKFKELVNNFDALLPVPSEAIGKSAEVAAAPPVSAEPHISAGRNTITAALPSPVSVRPAQVPPRPEEAPRKLFFWKATRGTDIVYLLGTIHAAPPTLYPLAREIESAFDSSRCLLLEVNIAKAKIDPEKVRQLVSTSGKYNPPDKLSRHLSPGTKQVFEAYLEWAGETWGIYESYKHWYARELISVPRRGDLSKMTKSYGIDLHFLRKAIAQKKPIDEFETVEFQLAIDSKLSEDVQDKLLQVTLLEMKDTEKMMASIFKAWKSGDMDQMEKVAVHQSVDNPELIPFTMALLNNRNVGMAAKIEPFLKTKGSPLFVAVGSAHMVGETGLVNLLRKKGFAVEQVTAAPPESKSH